MNPIKCSDRLPDTERMVLGYSKQLGWLAVSYNDFGHKQWTYDYTSLHGDEKPTHWMELPPAPMG